MHGEAGRLRRGMEAVVSQQVAHEGFGLVALHVAAVMAVDDETAVHLLHGAQVHPHGHLPRGEGHVHARGLQHAAPGVALPRVVAEDVQDSGVAACGNPRRDGLAQAGFAACKNAEVGQIKVFEGCFAAEGRNRIVAHAVADHQYILHGITLLHASRHTVGMAWAVSSSSPRSHSRLLVRYLSRISRLPSSASTVSSSVRPRSAGVRGRPQASIS